MLGQQVTESGVEEHNQEISRATAGGQVRNTERGSSERNWRQRRAER